MRLATIQTKDGTSAALVSDGAAYPVRYLPGRTHVFDVTALIREPLTQDEIASLREHGESVEPVIWLPPIRPPKNILCVGKNYVEHVKEGARAEGSSTVEIPTTPIWFTKAHTALVGHKGQVQIPEQAAGDVDYEGELAIVIGKRAKSVSAAEARGIIYGYTIMNDITARDVQQQRKQWFLGKSADSFAPCGPWIVTSDEISDPQNLSIRSEVNGEPRQSGNTRDMIFSVARLISDLSQYITLEPGDLISTGTPSGVAWGMEVPRYLSNGDTVSVTIEHIGTLSNTVGKARQTT